MTFARLILHSLGHFWRTNLGVALGIALASAVITGALLVGDSMRYTLALAAQQRLGSIDQAVLGGDRFFTAELAEQLGADSSGVVLAQGVASTPDRTSNANDVSLVGIDAAFQKMMDLPAVPLADQAILNQAVADQLGVIQGDTIIVRVPKPSALPMDAALVNASKPALAMRYTVVDVVGDDQGGRFSLRAEQRPPFNIFVNRDALAEQLEQPGRVNLALSPTAIDQIDPSLDDLALNLDAHADNTRRLTTPRIFLDASIQQDLADLPGQRLLTYMVNTISLGDQQSPYAMITAADKLGGLALEDDEIAINAWLAEDLGAAVGDTLTLTYYLPDEGDRLVEASTKLKIARIVPIDGLFADRTLTPDFPGLAEAEQLSRWDAGPAIDRSRIRDKDEAYWDDHRATPKAFINLATGQRLWTNRFGTLTAIRFTGETTEAQLLERIDHAALGFIATDLKGQAHAAARGTVDFGQLFLSLSGFIIIAAIVLAAMLFAMSAEQRARQLGTLLALGLGRGKVAALILCEGGVVAIVGALVGLVGAVAYAYAVASALGGVWSGAVAGSAVELHMTALSLTAGPISAVLISLLGMGLSIRGLTKRPARELLAGGIGKVSGVSRLPRSALLVLSFLFAVIAIALAVNASGQTGMRGALVGFAAGAACFAAGLSLLFALMVRRTKHATDTKPDQPRLSLPVLNLTRRRGRTLAGVLMLGAGLFLVFAVSGFHLSTSDDPSDRASGTGGFALLVESARPIPYDLNTELGRDHYALSEDELPPGIVVPLRVSGGDDASCLNLNQTPTPRLLGVDPGLLQEREAFTFMAGISDPAGWQMLDRATDNGVIPVIADANTAQWALKLAVGDTITIQDERGRTHDLQLVATIENSILQGSLILNQRDFKKLFPSTSGYAMMLIDAAEPEQKAQVASVLKEVLVDEGAVITPTNQRLAAYNQVQNTYLAVFQMLGGLGVLLGSLGLGVVTARNLLERRSELALLSAVGLSRGRIARIVLTEHAAILLLGLLLGTGSAWLATLHAGGHAQPISLSNVLTFLAPLLAGLLAILLGLLPAMSGRLTMALRND